MYTLALLESHDEKIPCTLPLLFESKASKACTLSSHSKVMPGIFSVPFHSYSRVKPTTPVHSHPTQKSCREYSPYTSTQFLLESYAGSACTLSPNSYSE